MKKRRPYVGRCKAAGIKVEKIVHSKQLCLIFRIRSTVVSLIYTRLEGAVVKLPSALLFLYCDIATNIRKARSVGEKKHNENLP